MTSLIVGNLLTTFRIDKYNGQITDFIIDREKYLITCTIFIQLEGTKKGHISTYSMLLESKLGYLYTDFD
jgi:factor associated with neutral sphingomyelinase activation